ncbi:MAG: nitroreductase family protein [bacterium]|nr:nitroreductase family protein [bacterium]
MKDEYLNLFLKRRSVREYKSEDIEKEVLENIIRVGMNAPSAGNQQPWEFIIITKREILNEIPEIHPYSQMLKQAPAAILVCGNPECKYPDYWVQDCAAATENILLAIHAEGLGGVWLGVYPLEERVKGLQKLLNIPENIVPFSLLSVGVPKQESEFIDRFEKKRIHYERW